jgi:hypothetical protein
LIRQSALADAGNLVPRAAAPAEPQALAGSHLTTASILVLATYRRRRRLACGGRRRVAAVSTAVPFGALLGSPLSYLTTRKLAADQTAPWVPFIVAFRVMALAMTVLIGVNVRVACRVPGGSVLL